MKHYIAKNTNGEVVGKWVMSIQPEIPDRLQLEEVDDVTNYSLDYWFER